MYATLKRGLILGLLGLSTVASAEVQTREVEYKQGDTPLQGFMAWDDAAKGKRPGVLVVHEWWGNNQNTHNQAVRLAQAGYVAFALDMFGKGKVTTHPSDANQFMQEATKDPATEKARFDAALEQLKQDPHTDPNKIAAIGYCFGGGVVLGMAEAGENLKAVATFHGAMPADQHPVKGTIKPKILIQSGEDDPMVPPAKVNAFKKEMTAAGASVQVVFYPGAQHAFTNPDADKAGVKGLAYNAKADKKSWSTLLQFLKKNLR